MSEVYTGSGRMRRRAPYVSRGLVVVLLAAGTLLVWSASASALLSRGHVFAGTFEGAGPESFSAPGGVAVDEASGEVYVVDSGHERVERFKPDGGGGYEFVGEFKVPSAGAIAIDNSSSASDPSKGDVYVAGAEEKGATPEERDFLYKFTATGGKIFKKSVFKAKEGKEEVEAELEDISGLAVDGAGMLWVYWGEEGVIGAFSDDEHNKLIPSLTKALPLEQLFECRARPGFALAPGDEDFYVGHERETALEGCPEEATTPTLVAKLDSAGRFLAKGLDSEDTTGVAVDPANGDVYADNTGSVAAFAPDGSFIERFGAGQLRGGGAIAVDSVHGKLYVAEPAEGRIAVFESEGAGPPVVDSVVAQNLTPSSERVSAQIDRHGADTHYYVQYGTASCVAEPSSCTDAPAPPGADIGSGFGDQLESVELQGLQANSTYYYRVLAENEHGAGESPQSTATFFTTLPSSEGVLADHREWELVSPPEKHGAAVEPISREGALIQASADGNSITWAASAPVAGEAEGDRRPEPVQVISTRGSEAWSSKDITTPHNRGEGIEPGEATEYRFFSPDLSLALVQPQVPSEPLEDPPLAPEAREKTLYRRDDTSGEYEPLVTAANDTASPTTQFGGKLEFAGATSDLGHVVFGSEVSLVAGAGERGLYEWEAGAALSLVSTLPGPEQKSASEPELGYQGRDVRGAISQDGSRVFWSNGGEEGPLYMHNTLKKETIQINAVQGEGVTEPSEEERSEGLDEVYFQAASSDGSSVFFTDTWPLTSESNLEPLSSEGVVEEPPAGSRNVGRPVDLYEFDVETGKLSDLTVDRHAGETADVLGTLLGTGEDGSLVYFVANGVLAPGAEPGDCPRIKPLLPHPEATCNLYVSEPDPEHSGERETKFIARLSDEDAGDWGGGNSPLPGDLGGVTAQVSSNGHYLAFMSARELTGYHNVDANPEAKGAHAEEVYVYDANTGRLVCASCNPSGEPPHGVFDTTQAGEGLGLTVDRPETWSGHWLAGSIPGWTLFELNNPRAEHQSRYLSNSGRLFFDSADALVPQDQARTRQESINGKTLSVGVENVYEFEPSGEGSCSNEPGCVALISSGTSERESAFLDAGENGGDVFFLTAAALVAQDTDTGLDVYDARVCGTSETQPCLPVKVPPPPACTGEGCRPPASGQLSFPDGATATYSGPGNTPRLQVSSSKATTTSKTKPLTRAQKLTKALSACHKLKRHKRRLACERTVRKTNGTNAKKTDKRAASPRKKAR